MTSEEIRACVSASVSSTPDTIAICEWLQEIALQTSLLNEELNRLVTQSEIYAGVLTLNEARQRLIDDIPMKSKEKLK